MKWLGCAVTIILLSFPETASAQPETLLGGDVEHGGYGGPVLKFTSFRGKWSVMVGGQGAWVIDNKFALGGCGYGLSTEQEITSRSNGLHRMYFGYVGLLMEYLLQPDRLTNHYYSLIIGIGGLGFANENSESFEGDLLFVIEPSFNLCLNVTTRIRLALGLGYRFVGGLDSRIKAEYELRAPDLGGPSINLTFRIGRY